MSKKKTIKTALVSRIAVAYARYSSNNQREESIDAQLRAIREYCERENIVLLECYVDEALTGQNDDRAGFQKMLEDIFRGHIKVDTVLVHKFNRFARNKFDSALYKKRLKDIGVRVISVTQPIDDSPEGAMLESIIEAMDEYYSANLALEVKKGLRENALQGKHTGGRVLYGLAVSDDGKYVPGDGADIVRRIFEEFADGVPQAVIIKRLNDEGFRNNYGRKFSQRTIFGLLRNEKYIGNFVYRLGNEHIRLDGMIEPIIDKELWARVQKRCNQQVRPRTREQNQEYLLTGKAVCGICGSQITGAGKKGLNSYYGCARNKREPRCTLRLINREWLEKSVLNAVLATVLDDEKLKEISRLAYEEIKAAQSAPEAQLKTLNSEYSEIKEQQTRLSDLYLAGAMSKDDMTKQAAELSARRAEVELSIERQQAIVASDGVTIEAIHDYVIEFVERMKKEHPPESVEFMRAVFNTFVDRVIVYPNEIKVFINADFSGGDGGGDKRQIAGAICRLSPKKFEVAFPRKAQYTHVHKRGRNK